MVFSRKSQMRKDRILKEFGKTLRAHRTALGWSQETLAERSDLHENYISRLETGEQEPGLFALLRLARAIGLPPGAMLKELQSGE